MPRGKTGERRRTHVPQALIISWPGASSNAFCIFAFLHFYMFAFLLFCKQRGCTFVAFGVFGQGSPLIIHDISLPHILAICWRMNIMNEVWRHCASGTRLKWSHHEETQLQCINPYWASKDVLPFIYSLLQKSHNCILLGKWLRSKGDLGNIIQGFSPTAVQHLCGSVVKTCWWLDPSAGRYYYCASTQA